MHPYQNNFVYLSDFENGDMFFFEAQTKVFFHESWGSDRATMSMTSEAPAPGGHPELDFTQSVFSTRSVCETSSYFTPDGEEYICMHGNDYNSKEVVQISIIQFQLCQMRYTASEIGFVSFLRISTIM